MGMSMEQERMVYDKLPKDISDILSESVEEISNSDEQNIKENFKKNKTYIESLLVDVYRYPSVEVEELISELFMNAESKIRNQARTKRNETIDGGTIMILNMSKQEVLKVEEVDDLQDKKETLEKSSRRIPINCKDIISHENIDANKSYDYFVEDIIEKEIKEQLKINMNEHDSFLSENAYLSISKILTGRLLKDLQKDFKSNSENLNNIVSSKVESVMEEFKHKYDKVISSKEQDKNEDKLGLGDLVNSPEEAYENTKEREQNEEKDEKQKEELISHVID